MKKLLIIILLCFFSHFVYAEVDIIEDYIEKIENQTLEYRDLEILSDNSRDLGLKALVQGHLALEVYDYYGAYAFLEEALELSDSDLIDVEALYYLMMLDMTFGDEHLAVSKAIELKALAHEIDDIKGIIRADFVLAMGYVYGYDYDEAKAYAEEALNLSESIGYDYGIWEYYTTLGDIALYQDEYDIGLEHYETAQNFSSTRNLKNIFVDPEVENIRNIARMYRYQNRPDKASKLLKPLLETLGEEEHLLKSKINYQLGEASTDIELSISYYETALDHYNLVIRERNYGDYVNTINKRLAYWYYSSGDYKKASDYYYRVTKYSGSEAYWEANSSILMNLETNKYDQVSEKMQLLEALAEAKTKELENQKRLVMIVSLGLSIILLLTVVSVLILRSRKQSREALKESMIKDKLTAVYNRSHILELLENNLQGDNAVVLIDLDDFRCINDQYGHQIGDEVLIEVANTLMHSVRGADVVGRLGGEEFLVILEKATQEECRIVAERMRDNIEQCSFDQDNLKITCSVGVTRVFTKDADEMLQYVDTLMAQAKSNGKNQVVYG